MELFFEIFLAAMAVFGLWCAMCLIAQSLLSSRNIGVVIEVFDESAAQNLPALLNEVRTSPLSRRHQPVAVLYSEELCLSHARPNVQDRAMIAQQGAQWYVVNIHHQGSTN